MCNILLPYDHDGNVPVYGFGGRLPNGQVSHCFALNDHPEAPEVPGVSGIMDAYHHAITTVGLSGPTYFGPIIQQTIQIAQANEAFPGSNYFVLLIITDGVINDMPETIRQIVYAANNIPLSIVIVGVGQADFTNMNVLDGDDMQLRDQQGIAATRDIVQFVPFSAFASCPQRLAEETLAEIPSQLCSFMRMRGILPRPPSAPGPAPAPGLAPVPPPPTGPSAPMAVPLDPSAPPAPMAAQPGYGIPPQ